jgi:50S ribosomal protein L16 3-hydroxylase
VSLLGTVPPETFFSRYWQREALVIRNAVPHLRPLTWEALRALACREDVESRLIKETGGAYPWEVVPGPFDPEELVGLPASGWSLLIHEVEAHIKDAAALANVEFLPRWHIDDVMVSSAPAGSSVGPHIDQYDAFLVQVEGARRWTLEPSRRDQLEDAFVDGPDLELLKTMSDTQEYVLEPGDVLYVPPGLAHHGVAIGHAQTWSIGMRAPAAHELVASFTDWALGRISPEQKYLNPNPQRQTDSARISPEEVAQMAEVVRNAIAQVDINAWLGEYLTAPARTFDPHVAYAQSVASVPHTGTLTLRLGVRAAFVDISDEAIELFVAGERFTIPAAGATLGRRLANTGTVECEALETMNCTDFADVIDYLLDLGFLTT